MCTATASCTDKLAGRMREALLRAHGVSRQMLLSCESRLKHRDKPEKCMKSEHIYSDMARKSGSMESNLGYASKSA